MIGLPMTSLVRIPRVLAAVLTLVLALAVAAPALAAEPPQIREPVTDETGALSGGEAEIEQAIDELLDTHNVQLWVSFISTTDGVPITDFVTETAEVNSLGANDVLMLVALDDRTDGMWVSNGLPEITPEERDAIIGSVIEPRLADGDFVGSAVAAAEALGEAATPAPTPPPGGGGTIGGPGDGGGGGDGGGLGSILAVLLILGGGGLIAWWFLSRRRRQQAEEERDRRTGKLAREANALLIATDERVRDANQEIGFVEAEYGEAEVQPLRVAFDEAREELRQAFAVRQRLDDAEPETPDQREAMLNEVLERSKRAQAALDREAARLQALRDLERDAPTLLEKLPARIEAVEQRLPTTQATFDSLAAFAPLTRQPVVGHLEEARKGIDGARAATERGKAALAAGNRRAAGRETRTAEQGLTGAIALLDAVDKLAATARDAEQRLPAELRDAEADLAAARAAASEAGGGSDVRAPLETAATALRQAQSAAQAVPLEPIGALRAATEAHRAADEALAAVRQDAEQRQRLLAAVETSLVTAQADLDRAADFIATRRGRIGRTARTRLAEADRLLEAAIALRDRDPQRALEAARRAERLAEDALDRAADDMDQFGGMGGTWGGGRSAGSDVAGAILGGILGGILSGGGRGGGWGGSPWGGPLGGGGGGGGGGGWGGPFGGGGGGGWGGGGFGGGGGGGGHAGGGRW
jgi:hypothetical protein